MVPDAKIIMKTKQEIFDAVWNYFIVEKHPQAITGEVQCVYRGEQSNCAVGCQLPDELYDAKMESFPIEEVMFDFWKVAEFFGEENAELLGLLQDAHDNWFPELEYRLREIAADHSLKTP